MLYDQIEGLGQYFLFLEKIINLCSIQESYLDSVFLSLVFIGLQTPFLFLIQVWHILVPSH